MFGNKNKENTTSTISNVSPNSNALNSLVKGTRIEGTISSDSDIRIDGTIKGTLNCKAKVIIGPTGVVEGEIVCENALIEGQFTGKLNVNGLLHLRETADISGDVTISKLIVDPGAMFNVTSCNMGKLGNRASTQAKVNTAKKQPA